MLWLQLGVISDPAAAIARAAGLDVVMDRYCKRQFRGSGVCRLVPRLSADRLDHGARFDGISGTCERRQRFVSVGC